MFQRAASEPPFGRPSSPTPSISGYSIIDADEYAGISYHSPGSSFKSFLPRLWDVLIPSTSKSTPLGYRHSLYHPIPSYSPLRKFKPKSRSLEQLDYSTLSPLDGEEGELIDDEACFVAVDYWGMKIDSSCTRATAVTGLDVLSLLPTELSLYILSLIGASYVPLSDPVQLWAIPTPYDPLMDLLNCSLVSKAWRRLARDNSVWRSLFLARWGPLDTPRMRHFMMCHTRPTLTHDPFLRPYHIHSTFHSIRDFSDLSNRNKALPPLPSIPLNKDFSVNLSGSKSPLNWYNLYCGRWFNLYYERLELERRWLGAARDRVPLNSRREHVHLDTPLSSWRPTSLHLRGHHDSVYCLVLTKDHIFTGSRDKTIKMWDLRTGGCIGTFGDGNIGSDGLGLPQAHRGSVLCLKFFWDSDRSSSRPSSSRASLRDNWDTIKKGTLYSGSSDCTIYIWDVFLLPLRRTRKRDSTLPVDPDMEECYVHAQVKAVLTGHEGGVLDLRVDQRWIVSCSKDTSIRVWDKDTLDLCHIFHGHEGPVNAVGVQNGRIVSASGDGKMILWDIETGQRVRTFDGHDRGLACIEFKDGIIVSGSNDCKIKIWSAETGDCIATFVGHTALVRALAYDSKTGRLVSASYDKSVRVWDVPSGRLLHEFRNLHTSHIFDVKFDISKIVSTSHDQNIVVLDFAEGLDHGALFE